MSKEVRPSVMKVLFLRSCCVCGRGTLATFGKTWVYSKTGRSTLYFSGRCHVQGHAGEARTHATWIRKSRYARFRASSVRDFHEDAQETLKKRMSSSMTSRQRGIWASIIASVSLCFATMSIDRLQVQCKPVGNGSIARVRECSPRSREHMPAIALDRHRHFLDRAAFG